MVIQASPQTDVGRFHTEGWEKNPSRKMCYFHLFSGSMVLTCVKLPDDILKSISSSFGNFPLDPDPCPSLRQGRRPSVKYLLSAEQIWVAQYGS